MKLVLATAAAALVACARPAAAPVSPVRFAAAPPVWVVDDRAPVPDRPQVRPDVGLQVAFEGAVTERLDRALAGDPARRALGTNSLDEVPSSTWFVNRVGVRAVTPDEVRHGPGDGRGPDVTALRVLSGKQTGKAPGFLAEDAAGVRWLIKLETSADTREGATDVAVQRLLWLVGYHVPENHVARVDRAAVRVGEGATFKDLAGRKRAMTDADLDAIFARAPAGPDGRHAILASKLLPGAPLGGTPPEGVRADDPNDTIPHERRRDLRGLGVFVAWLQHTDFREMGTLDVWQDDPIAPGRKVVLHYLVDFGNSLGMYARGSRRLDDGHVERILDVAHVRSLVSFGLWKRPWEGTPDPGIPGVAPFDAAHFDPGGFATYSPYRPLLEMDPLDARWAVKILLRVTEAHLRAALDAGGFEPAAVDHLVEVLVARQRKSARHWLALASPLDEVVVTGAGVCFVDLVARHALDDAPVTYRATAYDWHGARLGEVAVRAGAAGRACTAEVPRGDDHGGYTIVRLDVTRGGRALPALEVHLVADQVVGLEPHREAR